MSGCHRCKKDLGDCTGHWADDPRSVVTASIVTGTSGLIWSDVFPRSNDEKEESK